MSINRDYEAEDTSSAGLGASAKGIQQFQQAGIGLSVHWGLYTLSTEGNEWIYFENRIPFDTYRQRMSRFNPARFDAGE